MASVAGKLIANGGYYPQNYFIAFKNSFERTLSSALGKCKGLLRRLSTADATERGALHQARTSGVAVRGDVSDN